MSPVRYPGKSLASGGGAKSRGPSLGLAGTGGGAYQLGTESVDDEPGIIVDVLDVLTGVPGGPGVMLLAFAGAPEGAVSGGDPSPESPGLVESSSVPLGGMTRRGGCDANTPQCEKSVRGQTQAKPQDRLRLLLVP